MEPMRMTDTATARFESNGIGAIEINFDGLARLLAEAHPGGIEQSRRITAMIIFTATLAETFLPYLVKAQAEIMARREAACEPLVHPLTPEEEERFVAEFRAEVLRLWGQTDGTAGLLAKAAHLSTDIGPPGGSVGGGGAQAGQGESDRADG